MSKVFKLHTKEVRHLIRPPSYSLKFKKHRWNTAVGTFEGSCAVSEARMKLDNIERGIIFTCSLVLGQPRNIYFSLILFVHLFNEQSSEYKLNYSCSRNIMGSAAASYRRSCPSWELYIFIRIGSSVTCCITAYIPSTCWDSTIQRNLFRTRYCGPQLRSVHFVDHPLS